MNTINLSQVITSQRQTIARWQQNTNRDAADLAAEIARRFRLRARVEFEGFIWDIADMYAKQAAQFLSDLFCEELEQHFGRTIQSLQDELAPLVGDQAPNIGRTDILVSQRALSLAIDDDEFKKALVKAKPGILAHLLAPDYMDDNFDAWGDEQAARASAAVSAVVDAKVPELANSAAKFLDSALDEYLQGLSRIDQREPVVVL